MANMYDDDFEGKPYVPPEGPRAPVSVPQTRPSNMYDPDFGGATVPGRPPPPPQKPPNTPFGELKPASYSPSQWLGNKAQDLLIAGGASPYSAGHVGRGVVDAAKTLFPPLQAATSGADVIYHSNRGQPLQAAANAIGIAGPGGVMANRAISGFPQKSLAPTEAELARSAKLHYGAVDASPNVYSPQIMDDLTNEITRKLLKSGANEANAGKQFAGIEVGRGLKTQTGNKLNDIETLRRQVRGGSTPEEIRAGEIANEVIDTYLAGSQPAQHLRSGTPQQHAIDVANLEKARSNTAALKRSEMVQGKVEDADTKLAYGRDYAKTLRSKVESLETTKRGQREMAGFNEEEAGKLRDAMAASLAERAGKTLTNPKVYGAAGLGASGTTGYGQFLTGAGIDPLTAGAAGALTSSGMYGAGRGLQAGAGRGLGNRMETLAEDLRMRSPLAEGLSRYERVTDPRAIAQDAAQYLAYPQASKEAQQYVDEEMVPFANRPRVR